MKKLFLFLVVASLLVYCSLAQASTIGAHSGATDPESEGWVFEPGGGTTTVQGVTDELQAWQIQCSAGAQGRYLYGSDAATLGDSSGWTLTGVVKVNSTSGNIDDCQIGVLDSTSWWALHLTESGIHTWNSGFGYSNTISTIDPTDGYHVYQIIYDPSTDKVGLYVDGALSGTQGRSNVPSGYGIYRGQFGDNNGLGATDAQWGAVLFETGQTVYSSVGDVPGVVVPEPSTLAMFAAGLFALALVWRKR